VPRTVIKVHTNESSTCLLVPFAHVGEQIAIIAIIAIRDIACFVHSIIPLHVVHLVIAEGEVVCSFEERHIAIKDSRRL
jgi:hypothetical protein